MGPPDKCMTKRHMSPTAQLTPDVLDNEAVTPKPPDCQLDTCRVTVITEQLPFP